MIYLENPCVDLYGSGNAPEPHDKAKSESCFWGLLPLPKTNGETKKSQEARLKALESLERL